MQQFFERFIAVKFIHKKVTHRLLDAFDNPPESKLCPGGIMFLCQHINDVKHFIRTGDRKTGCFLACYGFGREVYCELAHVHLHGLKPMMSVIYLTTTRDCFLPDMTWLTKDCETWQWKAIADWLIPLTSSNAGMISADCKPCQERALQKIKCFIECIVILLTYGEGVASSVAVPKARRCAPRYYGYTHFQTFGKRGERES